MKSSKTGVSDNDHIHNDFLDAPSTEKKFILVSSTSSSAMAETAQHMTRF